MVPPAATEHEAQNLYVHCIDTIRNSKGGNNEAAVIAFRENCKAYGLNHINAMTFHASLVNELGAAATSEILPALVRLIPDESKRRELLAYDASVTGASMAAVPARKYTFSQPSPSRDSTSSNAALDCDDHTKSYDT